VDTRTALAALIVALGPGLARAAATDVVINEVFYLGASNADEWIELKNTGTDSIDVGGWFFCARFDYQALANLTILHGDDFNLGPGEIVALQSDARLSLDSVSDLGLYSTSLFADPNNMVDFVQWGTDSIPGGGRSSVARDKGIWTETSPDHYDFVPQAAAGESAAFDGTNGGGGLLTLGSDFANGTPTPGTENPTAVEPTSWGRVKSLYKTD
jgi:hypothetical protein